MGNTSHPSWRRRRGIRGQTTTEAVIILMFLMLIFLGLAQVVNLYTAQMLSHHSANVAARSYVVGFNREVVRRAANVGAIGMSGRMTEPAWLSGTGAGIQGIPFVERALLEPELIEEYIGPYGFPLRYERWDNLDADIPNLAGDMVTIGVDMRDYPMDLGLNELFMRGDSFDLEAEARLFNHADYYLE